MDKPKWHLLQRLDIVQLGNNAPDIANAVAIRVFEARGIDLIDGCAFPPGNLEGRLFGKEKPQNEEREASNYVIRCRPRPRLWFKPCNPRK